MEQTVLITGCAGFIPSSVVKRIETSFKNLVIGYYGANQLTISELKARDAPNKCSVCDLDAVTNGLPIL